MYELNTTQYYVFSCYYTKMFIIIVSRFIEDIRGIYKNGAN